MGPSVTIVYLDQNKWIDLARAAKHPEQHPEVHALLKSLAEGVKAGRVLLPLTFTNIYETQKINDTERRSDLAFVQCTLSRGLVFRGRFKRLEIELSDFARAVCGLPEVPHEENWFLSSVFFESVAEYGDPRIGPAPSESVLTYIRNHPEECLFEHLTGLSEEERRLAVKKFSEGSDALRKRIEARRIRDAEESLSMRRRIYSAMLMVDDIDFILEVSRKAGASWSAVSDIGSSNARKIMTDVATYYIERELTLRLEAQTRAINENDFRDMQSFCAVVSYADHVIAENQFSNLARQAGLDKRFQTHIATSIMALGEILSTTSSPQQI
jgi:hypothetical protein